MNDFLSASPDAVLETNHIDSSLSHIPSTNGWVPLCLPTNDNVYNVGEPFDLLGPATVKKQTFTYYKSSNDTQGWISHSIMCYQKGCSFQAKPDSADYSMSCRQFMLSSKGQHTTMT